MALSRELILSTAFDLLCQYGLADLSMRRLATELQVAPGALYYHVKNKQQLLASLASRMVENVTFSGSTPAQALECGAREVFCQLSQVREAAEVVRVALALHPEELSFVGRAADLFIQLGVPEHNRQDACGQVSFSVPANNSQEQAHSPARVAAKTLLHTCLSLLEEEQTRAILEGKTLSAEVPENYLLATQALISGWSTSR